MRPWKENKTKQKLLLEVWDSHLDDQELKYEQ